MCIFIVALMLILFYALSGSMDAWQLVEQVNEQSVTLAIGWEMVHPLWMLLALAFLAGVLAVLLIMKLIPAQADSSKGTS